MATRLSAADLTILAKKGGGEAKALANRELGRVDQGEVDRLAMRVVGVLADASSQAARRRALEKARRMVGTR